MPKALFVLMLLSLIAVAQARAADELEKKPKSGNKIERAVEKAGAALGKTADKVERKVKKGVAATEKAIDSAGKKTGQWLKEKTKTD
jgi:Tfp pilus assembly protein PilX